MEFGLIGEHLQHSFSAEIHKYFGYGYSLVELPQERLGEFLARREFRGINVTLPYKQAVIPFLDELSPQAEKIGAVNTVVNSDGWLVGHNTDYDGFAALASRAGIDFRSARVLVLGRGGAARAVKAVAMDNGAEKCTLTGRDTDYSANGIGRDYDIIVNATPVGMSHCVLSEAELPIDIDEFPNLTGVLDCIYNPVRTPLVSEAQLRGLKAEGGLYMLVCQAVKAAELFTGQAPMADVGTIFGDIAGKKLNIVIIGMPSCGKSTYARMLSRQTGRAFADTDSLIEEAAGKGIPQIFEESGEEYFRRLEAETVREVSAWQGCIIATGGGVVLNRTNMINLRKNGHIIYLQADINDLHTGGRRPLSKDAEALRSLYLQRHPLYMKYADETVLRDDFTHKA